jgi:hypothetical protein
MRINSSIAGWQPFTVVPRVLYVLHTLKLYLTLCPYSLNQTLLSNQQDSKICTLFRNQTDIKEYDRMQAVHAMLSFAVNVV